MLRCRPGAGLLLKPSSGSRFQPTAAAAPALAANLLTILPLLPLPARPPPPLSATAVAAVLNVRTRRHTHPEKNKTKQKKKTIQDACPTSDAPAAGATFRYQTRPQVKNKMQNSASNSFFFFVATNSVSLPALHRAPDGNIWPESEKAVGALPCDLRRTKSNRNGGRRRGGPRM